MKKVIIVILVLIATGFVIGGGLAYWHIGKQNSASAKANLENQTEQEEVGRMGWTISFNPSNLICWVTLVLFCIIKLLSPICNPTYRAHLHLTIREDNVPVNPRKYLTDL